VTVFYSLQLIMDQRSARWCITFNGEHQCVISDISARNILYDAL